MKIFYLPDLGEGLPDAEIREWLIKEGDEVKVDQPIVSMETAKALVDVPSPYTGRISKLYGHSGDIIKTGAPLVGYETEDENLDESSDAGTVVGHIEVGNKILQESAMGISPSKTQTTHMRMTPAVRNMAKELNIDLNTIKPTGPNNTITIQDLKQTTEKTTSLLEGFEPLHGVRRAMAINMVQSHAAVVPVTIVEDADIQAIPKEEDLTFRLIRAVIAACKAEPALNAHFDGKNISRRLFDEINIGLAVDTPAGLFVPVIKDAQTLSKEALRSLINNFKQQAQGKEFSKEVLQGATITLSNFGVFVGRYASPIVIPPTVAILGVGKLRDEVVAISLQPSVHRILPISLTFDHRAVTGGEAARFLAALIGDLSQL